MAPAADPRTRRSHPPCTAPSSRAHHCIVCSSLRCSISVEQNGRAHPSLRLCGSAAGLRHSCGRPGLRSAAALRHRRTLFPDQRTGQSTLLLRTRLLHWSCALLCCGDWCCDGRKAFGLEEWRRRGRTEKGRFARKKSRKTHVRDSHDKRHKHVQISIKFISIDLICIR